MLSAPWRHRSGRPRPSPAPSLRWQRSGRTLKLIQPGDYEKLDPRITEIKPMLTVFVQKLTAESARPPPVSQVWLRPRAALGRISCRTFSAFPGRASLREIPSASDNAICGLQRLRLNWSRHATLKLLHRRRLLISALSQQLPGMEPKAKRIWTPIRDAKNDGCPCFFRPWTWIQTFSPAQDSPPPGLLPGWLEAFGLQAGPCLQRR